MDEAMDNLPSEGAEPQLRKKAIDPRGVLQKNLKPLMYLGAAGLVILAAILSAHPKTASKQSASPQQSPVPVLQDNTDNNIQELKQQLAAEKQREAEQSSANDATLALATPAQRAAASGLGATGQPVPCVPGQPCNSYSQYGQQSVSPAQEQAEQLAAKEKQLAYDSRFASNLAYTRSDPPSASAAQHTNTPVDADPQSSLITPRVAESIPNAKSDPSRQSASEVNIDSATGQPYVLYEGTTADTVLMNRLDGDAVGPVKAMVSNPVNSHDRQHVLIPDGTIVLGEARKIGSSGFGRQRRLAVVFHRMIMPDGYSVDLDQFHGLDQIGEEGLKDKVNNHYLEIFGTSIALGVIAGAAQVTQGGGVYGGSGPEVYTNGAASSVSQSATTIMDRFMQIPPTITIREGHRIKVYFTQDMLLPAYDRHTIPQTF